ncbi:hypothetical protein J6590_063473 [Homalodisca vitripennis]|nr:hypothetical protein J6590_063473 [Homalodisca vitripennis]
MTDEHFWETSRRITSLECGNTCYENEDIVDSQHTLEPREGGLIKLKADCQQGAAAARAPPSWRDLQNTGLKTPCNRGLGTGWVESYLDPLSDHVWWKTSQHREGMELQITKKQKIIKGPGKNVTRELGTDRQSALIPFDAKINRLLSWAKRNAGTKFQVSRTFLSRVIAWMGIQLSPYRWSGFLIGFSVFEVGQAYPNL